MKRLMLLFAAATVLAACGSAAANDREVASLSSADAGRCNDRHWKHPGRLDRHDGTGRSQ